MTYTPDTPLEALAGIGPKKAQAFQKLGVATLRDLAGLYPRRYEDRTQFRTIADAQPGEAVCIRAAVAAAPRAQYVRSGLTLVKVRIADDTGALDVTYFSQPYRKNNLHAGETYIFYGKVEANGFRKTMTNPVCEQAARCGTVTNCFYPVYPLTTGVTQNDIRKAMTPALHACIGQLQDVIPADIARAYQLAQQDYALQNIHQPANAQALDTARKRLVFEELFVLSTAMARIRSQRRAEGGIRMKAADLETFYRTLPFSPTGAQRRAVAAARGRDPLEVALDRNTPHARLVATQVKYLARAEAKLPSYAAAQCILPPLAFEQASSEACAAHKQIAGGAVLDLTCGLGGDAFFLARRFRRVVALERDQTLARIAAENFRRLGAENIDDVNTSAEA